jgi:hypothetical protein
MVGVCEHGNESLGVMPAEDVFEHLNNCEVLKEISRVSQLYRVFMFLVYYSVNLSKKIGYACASHDPMAQVQCPFISGNNINCINVPISLPVSCFLHVSFKTAEFSGHLILEKVAVMYILHMFLSSF